MLIHRLIFSSIVFLFFLFLAMITCAFAATVKANHENNDNMTDNSPDNPNQTLNQNPGNALIQNHVQKMLETQKNNDEDSRPFRHLKKGKSKRKISEKCRAFDPLFTEPLSSILDSIDPVPLINLNQSRAALLGILSLLQQAYDSDITNIFNLVPQTVERSNWFDGCNFTEETQLYCYLNSVPDLNCVSNPDTQWVSIKMYVNDFNDGKTLIFDNVGMCMSFDCVPNDVVSALSGGSIELKVKRKKKE